MNNGIFLLIFLFTRFFVLQFNCLKCLLSTTMFFCPRFSVFDNIRNLNVCAFFFLSLSFCHLFLNHIRSVPLKSQLNTYTEKGKIPVLDFLSAALESVEYERALARGLVSSNTSFFSDVFLLSHSGKFSVFFFLRKKWCKVLLCNYFLEL